MKNKIAQFLMMVGLTAGLAVFAQGQTGSIHKVEIPFDFIVSGKTFKAGKYSVSFGVLQNSRESFLIRTTGGKQTALITQVIPKESDESRKNDIFVFNVYNGQYFLTEINTAVRSVEIRNSTYREKSGKRVEVATVR